MIKLQNIEITYDYPLLKHNELTFDDATFNLLIGRSGSGKTSLLYCIGLLTNNDHLHYEYNHKLITSFQEKELLRKVEFGFVLQDNCLFEHYDVMGNMELYGCIAGYSYNEKECIEILEQLNLHISIHQQINTLSGGEKQRLAIACALCKKPSVLLLDEVTSSLDRENEKEVLNVLKNLAKTKCIILASHSKFTDQYAEKIYKIENGSISCIKKAASKNEIDDPKQQCELQLSFYIKYIQYFFKKYHTMNYSILLIMFMSLFLLLLSNPLITYFSQNSIENFNGLYDKQIFITNSNENKFIDQTLKGFGNEWYNKLSTISSFESEPYLKTIAHIDGEYFYVIPYFNASDLDDKVQEHTDEESDGLYVTHTVANKIKNADFVSLEIDDYTKKEELSVQVVVQNVNIAGFLKETVKCPYIEGDSYNFIYMNNSKLQEIYKEQEINTNLYSGYTLRTETYFELNDLIQELNKMGIGVNDEFANMDVINELYDQAKTIKIFSYFAIGFIFFIMFSTFQFQYLYKRQFEFSLLILNGLNYSELRKLTIFEFLAKYIFSCICSIMFALITIFAINQLGYDLSSITIFQYFLLVILGVITLIATLFFHRIYFKNISIEKILRD